VCVLVLQQRLLQAGLYLLQLPCLCTGPMASTTHIHAWCCCNCWVWGDHWHQLMSQSPGAHSQ
jgi:hypothetical protein